jgi:hypothetical protein
VLLWRDRPCFLVSELSKALDSVNKEDIPVFLRYGGNAMKGIDYDVVAGADARDLRSYLENSGVKKRFAHTMLIYFDGLRKYFNYRKTVESRDFLNYLEKSKISLDAESIAPVGKPEPPAEAVKPIAEPKPASSEKPVETAAPASVQQKAAKSKQETPANVKSPSSDGYSELLKQISFMEEFVDAFNKIKITPDKSVAFTKCMAKFLEDNGIQTNKFLQEIKKWIV